MIPRLLRVPVAAAGAFVLSWPLVALHGDERSGLSVSWWPAFQVACVALVAGLVFEVIVFLTRTLEARRRVPSATALPPWTKSASLAAALVSLAVFPLFRRPGDAMVGLIFETLVYATIAVGLNITIGMAGLLVLGHAAFWAVGAYSFVLTTVHLHWNFWIAFPAAGLCAAFAGLLVGLPALRLRGDYLAVVTLGFGEAIRWVFKNEQHWTGGDAGAPGSEVRGSLTEPQGFLGRFLWQPGTGADSGRECYWFALALLLVCITSVTLLSRSRVGRALFALREDETAAKCMGIDTVRVKLVAFLSSAMWAGLAGVATAVSRGSISPDLFDFSMSVTFVAMVVIGGLGSIAGSVVGAGLLWMLPVLLQTWLPDIQRFRLLALGAVMCAMMVVRPVGLFGEDLASRMTALLDVRSVTKRFGGLKAVSDVSCTVEEGSVTAIIGPNGAGKTTLFNCITAVAPPTSGEIRFEGRPIHRMKPHQVTRLGMARTFQNIRLFRQMSALENVVTARHCRTRSGVFASLLRLPSMREEERRSREVALELLDFVGLAGAAETGATNLPYGDQRRLEIARALATEPRLLLLDEPAAGMNPRESLDLIDLIRRISARGVTVVLIEHHMKVVMGISTHVVVLDHGEKIADCTPEACRSDPAVIEAYLGKEDVT